MSVDEQPGGASGAAALDVDPAHLHDAGTRVAAAADDARPGLAAATAGDCGGGFPGTAAAAYAELIARLTEEDAALLGALDALSARLHTVAGEYEAADRDAAARVHHAATAGGGRPALNL